MAFLKEGAVKDLLSRGPSLESLLEWIEQNIVSNDDISYDEIAQYLKSFGLTEPEFETFINVLMGRADEEERDYLYDLLSRLENRDKAYEFFNQKHQNKNINMKDSILMPRLRNRLNEDHHKEASDESQMAKIQLKSIMADAAFILQGLDNEEQLDAWVQSKLTLAEDYLSSIKKYLQYEEESAPQELPLIPQEGGKEEEMEAIPAEEPIMPPMGGNMLSKDEPSEYDEDDELDADDLAVFSKEPDEEEDFEEGFEDED